MGVSQATTTLLIQNDNVDRDTANPVKIAYIANLYCFIIPMSKREGMIPVIILALKFPNLTVATPYSAVHLQYFLSIDSALNTYC